FTDKFAGHLRGFGWNGKGDITIIQLLTHQGGFPNAQMPKAAWADHDLMRRTVCAFTLEWTPGSRVHYHGLAAHWTAAAMIEALTKSDYRDFIRANVVEPLGLGNELFVGLPEAQHGRSVDMHEPAADSGRQVQRAEENNAAVRSAGTAAAARPIAGPTPTRACPSRISPIAAYRIPGTASAWTSSRISPTRPFVSAMAKSRVLVTGMSGLIGRAFRKQVEGRYDLRALNRSAVEGLPCHQADIADFGAIKPAFAGVETVVHLAAQVGNPAWEAVLRHNITGTYNVFEAAREAGVKRVVFASSGAAVSGIESDKPYSDLVAGRYEGLQSWPILTH